MTDRFTDEEVRAIAIALGAGEPLTCPACRVPLDERAVPPRSDVPYVRNRLWLVCPTCHRTTVLDHTELR